MRKWSNLPFTLLSIGKCWSPHKITMSMNRTISSIFLLWLWLYGFMDQYILIQRKWHKTIFFLSVQRIWLIDFYLSNHVPFDHSHNSRDWKYKCLRSKVLGGISVWNKWSFFFFVSFGSLRFDCRRAVYWIFAILKQQFVLNVSLVWRFVFVIGLMFFLYSKDFRMQIHLNTHTLFQYSYISV